LGTIAVAANYTTALKNDTGASFLIITITDIDENDQ